MELKLPAIIKLHRLKNYLLNILNKLAREELVS